MSVKLLTAADLAERLRVSRHTAYKLKSEIGYVRIGGSVRFSEAAVDAYVANHTYGQPKPRAEVVALPKLTLRRK